MKRWVMTAALAFAACAPTTEDLSALIEESRACGEGDTCALAGGGTCTCDTPVNGARAAEVDELARRVACYGAMVECPSHFNMRCEAGRCTSDRNLE
jgi:hypothetical protein